MASFPNDATYIYNGTTYSMSNRRPDRNYTYSQGFENSIFLSQIGYERRRQISRRRKRTITLTYSNILGVYKQALENFFTSRAGTFEAFEFDLSYAGQSGTMIVRFDSELSITQTIATDNPLTDVYTVSFTLRETFS